MLTIVWPGKSFRARSICGSGVAVRNDVDFAVEKVLRRVFGHDPLDIADGIEPDIVGHEARQLVRVRIQEVNPDALAPHIRNGADAVVGDQFEAADMHAGQHLNRYPGLDGRDVHRRHVHIEIRIATSEPLRIVDAGVTCHLADIGDAVGTHQFSGKEDGCPAVELPTSPDGRWSFPGVAPLRHWTGEC